VLTMVTCQIVKIGLVSLFSNRFGGPRIWKPYAPGYAA
jgi:hypothetical protein